MLPGISALFEVIQNARQGAMQVEVSLCLYISSDLGLLSDRGTLHFYEREGKLVNDRAQAGEMEWQSEIFDLYARISIYGYHLEDLVLEEPWPSPAQQRPRYAISRGPCEVVFP